MSPALCHPDRKAHACALCRKCYDQKRMQLRADNRSTCHPDRACLAKGLCSLCYHKVNAKKRRESNRIHHNALRAAWSKANPDKMRRMSLKANFGITPEGYAAILASQGGVCAICKGPAQSAPIKTGNPPRHAHIDHDHRTGQVRGVLCGPCNLMLGHAKDRPDVLHAAAEYLRIWSKKAEPIYGPDGELQVWHPAEDK